MSYPDEESVYDLIRPPKENPPKSKRYVSTFSDSVRRENRSCLTAAKTLGPLKVQPPNPKRFLRKHTKDNVPHESGGFHYPDEGARRPPVPKVSEKPLMGFVSDRDYISSNALEVIKKTPRKPVPKYADTCQGDTFPLVPSGLVKHYVKKKDYGRTPEYLQQMKEEERRLQEEYNQYVHQTLQRGAMDHLDEQERLKILEGLKLNWEAIHRQYQGMSLVIDSTPKRLLKEKLEAQMSQLEKDIDLLERFHTIYISKTDHKVR